MKFWKIENYNVICENEENRIENVPVGSYIIPIITENSPRLETELISFWVNDKFSDKLEKLKEQMEVSESNSYTGNYFATPENITDETVIFDSTTGLITTFKNAFVQDRNYKYILWQEF